MQELPMENNALREQCAEDHRSDEDWWPTTSSDARCAEVALASSKLMLLACRGDPGVVGEKAEPPR